MLHKPFNVVEPDWTRAGVAEAYAITPVVSIEEPHPPSVTATGVGACEYLMRYGQAAHR